MIGTEFDSQDNLHSNNGSQYKDPQQWHVLIFRSRPTTSTAMACTEAQAQTYNNHCSDMYWTSHPDRQHQLQWHALMWDTDYNINCNNMYWTQDPPSPWFLHPLSMKGTRTDDCHPQAHYHLSCPVAWSPLHSLPHPPVNKWTGETFPKQVDTVHFATDKKITWNEHCLFLFLWTTLHLFLT